MRCSLFFLVCWIVIAIKHPFTNAVERLLKTEEEFELIRWRRQSSGLYTHSFNEEFWHKSVDRPCKVYCPWQEEFVCWYRQKYVFSYIFKRLEIGLETCFLVKGLERYVWPLVLRQMTPESDVPSTSAIRRHAHVQTRHHVLQNLLR